MSNLQSALAVVVGQGQLFLDGDIGERYRVDTTRRHTSRPCCLVRPATTAEVAAVIKIAAIHDLPVTVVGGQTGTVGGAVPRDGGLALSLERMNQIVETDPMSMTMTVEAGCILQHVQEAAEAERLFLPLDLGSRGSATIGGVIAANAGGNRVLRWGMMRDMVLGLEVVLADGTIISSLTKMLKDNAGYNWKHLLIGSEGTLGVVTRAVLRLRPAPTTRQTAIIAMDSFEEAARVLHRLEVGLSGRLSSFELMWQEFFARMTEGQLGRRPRPLPLDHGYYAVVEAMGGDPEGDAAQFERVLGALIEEGLMRDAVIAQSDREAEGLWAVREEMEAGLRSLRPFSVYDVSMGLGDMRRFVDHAEERLKAAFPEAVVLFYGHAGDGNLHAIVSIGRMSAEIQRAYDEIIYGAVREVNGSIAAEHGIGVSRAPFLPWTRSTSELALMRQLKATLDPLGILNRGKLLDALDT